jgi:hypothetical protein
VHGLRLLSANRYRAASKRRGRACGDGEPFEMRTRFDDVADLMLGEIVLEPSD